ncbi:A-factor biosynthesis protein [Streptomyces sp. tea 10]|nr:A-factor biosynthesis protein [Streptomyces sp. tea 10]
MQTDRTLPKALVHRVSIAEVFLTDARRHGEDDLVLAAQLPRLHAFYDDTLAPRAGHDPLMLLEACRQGIFVVAHEFLGVPLDHKFLLRTVEFEVLEPGPPARGAFPTDMVIGTRIERRARGRSGVTGLRLRFLCTADGHDVMTAGIEYSWLAPRQWDRLRAVRRADLELPAVPVAPPVQRIRPELVDRGSAANAVISPARATADGGLAARLVPDIAHPVMFDHWVDHVPGMLELEACRQLAVVASVAAGTLPTPAARPTALHARFRAFGELDLPLECRTGPVLPGSDIACTLSQRGAPVADARIRLAAPDRAEPAGAGAGPRALDRGEGSRP